MTSSSTARRAHVIQTTLLRHSCMNVGLRPRPLSWLLGARVRLLALAGTLALFTPVVLGALAPAGFAPAASAASPKRPDLVVTKLSGLPASAVGGSGVTTRVEVKNRGARKAKASKLTYLLSRNSRPDASDQELGPPARVHAIKSRKAVRLSTTLLIPAVMPPGRYRVLACADLSRKVKEKREGNNCRASGPIEVVDSPPSTAFKPRPGAAPPNGLPADGGTGGGSDPNPRDVTVSWDDSAGTSGTIGPEGGGLQFTYDAITWKLFVPKDALTETVQVSMRPVTGVDGYPFSRGAPVAVQLAPEGLTLLKPAILEISPDPSIDPANLTTFAWHGNGDDFHLYPMRPGTSQLTYEISHFSGYGAGGATDAERAEQLSRKPRAPMDQAQQTFGEIARDQRECQLAGTACRSAEDVTATLREALLAAHPRVLSDLGSASTDQAGDAAIAAGLTWMRQVQLYGFEDELASESNAVGAAISSAVSTAYDRAWARCASWPTAPAALRRMISVARSAQLGLGGPLDESRFDRCVRFRVSFDSTIEVLQERGDPPGPFTEATYSMKVDDVLLSQVDWFNKFHGSKKAEIEEDSLRKRWCENWDEPDHPEYLCEEHTRALQSVGEFGQVGAFAYGEFAPSGPPVVDLVFPTEHVDVESKIKRIGPDGVSSTSTTTEHDVRWTEHLAGVHPEEVARARAAFPYRGENWFRPELTGGASGPWTWQSPTPSEDGPRAESQMTVNWAGGEGG